MIDPFGVAPAAEAFNAAVSNSDAPLGCALSVNQVGSCVIVRLTGVKLELVAKLLSPEKTAVIEFTPVLSRVSTLDMPFPYLSR